MSIVHKTKGCHKIFSDVSDAIFRKVLAEGSRSKRIDVVFDVYLDQSIKNAERAVKRGASSAISFKNIQAGHKIQQWDLFIKSSKNKTSLIQFLAKEWRQESYRNRLAGKTMFIGYDTECWKLTESTAQEATELRCAHEEADTRLLLHAKNAAEEGCEAVIIVSEDTDVFVLAVANRYGIQATMYQKRGTQARSRYVNITSIADALGYKRFCKQGKTDSIKDIPAYTIDWMSVNPAPSAILELMSCNCSRSCDSNRCSCVANGLRCTDMCRLRDCSNQDSIDDDDEVLNDSDDEDSDENTDSDEA
eukprot:gene19746-21683_t